MNYLIIVFTSLMLFVSCHKPKRLTVNDYCNMLEKDQILNESRNKVFKENYLKLVREIDYYGFPSVDFTSRNVDSCKYWSITATLIHAAQAYPEIFFSNENIELLGSEIKIGNLIPGNLLPVFNISSTTHEFCEELRPNIYRSIREWKMSEKYTSKFKQCNGVED